MVSFGTHTCKSANVADHDHDKCISECPHVYIHMWALTDTHVPCIYVIIRSSWEFGHLTAMQYSATASAVILGMTSSFG